MPPEQPMLEEGRATPFSDEALAQVYELNEQFLDTLAEATRHATWPGSSWHQALGLSLDGLSAQMRASLSRVPICLVDLGFGDGSLERTSNDSSRSEMPGFLAWDRAVELSRMTLTLAWTFARMDLFSASIVFSLPLQDAKALLASRVRLSDLADRLCFRLRPLWLAHPRIWGHILTTSTASGTDRLPGIRVRLLQRRLADLMLAPSASGSPRTLRR